MIKVYKHFNKPYEVFMGLSFFKIIKLALATALMIYLICLMKLSPSSPLSLFVLMPWILITSIIVKSDSSYFWDLFTHPFKNHIYLINSLPSSLYPNLDLAYNKVEASVIYLKDGSIAQILEVKHGVSIQNLCSEDRAELLRTWSGFLSQYSSLTKFDDYFSTSLDKEELEFLALRDSNAFRYFIVIKQRALNSDSNKIERLLLKLLNKLGIFTRKEYDYREELELIREKLKFLRSYIDRLKLNTKVLNDKELETCIQHHLKGVRRIHDKGKYLENKDSYIKTYSLKTCPESGDLEFWLQELTLKLKCKASLKLSLEYRDAHRDRLKAESRLELLGQMKKSQRASTQASINDNKSLAASLVEKAFSFNMSLSLCIEAQSLEELKRLDRIVSSPIRNCSWSSEERKQIPGLVSQLACNKHQSYKHFADLDFISASFFFFAPNFPKDQKYFIGRSLTDGSSIRVNEANKDLHKTRSINFIGDSGSGKSLLAKSMISKRLLGDEDYSFYIIDSSKGGWKEFTESLGGELIDLNKSREHCYFNPLFLDTELLAKSQNLLKFFSAISDQTKLSLEDQDFLTNSLRAFLSKHPASSLSDLYLFWSHWDNATFSQNWQKQIAPYCQICNGAYAYLVDSFDRKPRAKSDKCIQLFQFSDIKQEQSFTDLCIYLISSELEQRSGKAGKFNLVIDEAWKLSSSKKAKEFISYFARAGRALDIALWTISQKPSDLSKDIYSSASINISFQLKERSDREQLKSLVGFEEHELELFENKLLKTRANCLIKTNFGSDLVQVMVNDKEEILFSSEKDLEQSREKIKLEILENA